MISYDPVIKIEASQKGWLLVRALARMLECLANFEASSHHDWQAYDKAKQAVVDAFGQFEVWHGRLHL